MGSDVLIAVKVTAAVPGVVAFHEVTNQGGCGQCTRTAPINTCLPNNPFQTVRVYRIPQCPVDLVGSGAGELRRDTDTADGNSTELVVRQAANQDSTEPQADCGGVNVINVAGRRYAVDNSNRAAMVADFLEEKDDSVFSAKWEHMDVGEDTESYDV
jgi:hypothetical protein